MDGDEPNGMGGSTGTSPVATAQRYAVLCRRIDRIAPEDPAVWIPLEHRVEWTESFAVEVSQSFCLDSDALLALASSEPRVHIPSGTRQELIPLVPLNPATQPHKDIAVISLDSRRYVTPTPIETLERLLREEGAWPRYLAVPLNEAELKSSPVVRFTTTAPGFLDVFRRFRLRQLLPVSEVQAGFGEQSQMPARPESGLVVSLPPYANADVVTFRCAISWSTLKTSVERMIRVAEQQKRLAGHEDREERPASRSLSLRTKELVRDTRRDLTDITNEIFDAAQASFRAKIQRKWEPPKSWTEDLYDAQQQIETLERTLPEIPAENLDTAIAQAREFQTVLDSCSGRFTYPSRLSATGKVDLSTLRSRLGGLRDHFGIESMVVPFTSERDPGTQGKRSGLILLVLALVMFGIALVDLTWLPRNDLLAWLPNYDVSTTGFRAGQLRDSLVALLVIFPAALYGQFFQTRPHSPVGNRAQSGTFAALSIVFALPILPAALAAGGSTLATVSIATVVTGIVAGLGGLAVLFTFNKAVLFRLRRRSAVAIARQSYS